MVYFGGPDVSKFEPWDYEEVYAKYGKLYRALFRKDIEALKIMKIKMERIIQGTYKRTDARDDYLSLFTKFHR